MPRLNFGDIVSRVKDITNVSSKDNLIKQGIQMGLDEATKQDLPYLMSPGAIETVAPYETGTVAVTNGSPTVTGTGTTFTSAMVGRKIRIQGDNAYYLIKTFTSTTAITLDTNYVGTTSTSATYSIYKDEYRLPADADSYKIMRQIADKQIIVDIEPTAFDLIEPSPSSGGSPDFSVFRGTKLDVYSTGTVSGTVNTKTLTGSSTSWTSVEGLRKGTRLTIGAYSYTVKSVDSDTQISLYENLVVTVSASTYEALLDNLVIQFFQIPDAAEIVRFYYQRNAFPLVGDTDIPDMPDKFHHILVTAGQVWAWATKDKEEAARQFQIFNIQMEDFWKRAGHISKSRIIPRRSMDDFTMFPLSSPRLPDGYGYPMSILR